MWSLRDLLPMKPAKGGFAGIPPRVDSIERRLQKKAVSGTQPFQSQLPKVFQQGLFWG